MSTSELLTERSPAGLGVIILNHPEVQNAFDEAQIARITQAFEATAGNPGVRAVVQRARGRHFCAGADVGWIRRAAQASESENVRDVHHFFRMMQAVAV